MGEMSVMDTCGRWELVFTLERKAEPILVGTLTIRKTFSVIDTGTSIKKNLKKEKKWHLYTRFIGQASRLNEKMRSNSGKTAFLYIILNFIHTIFNLCGREVVVNTAIQVIMNDIDLFISVV